MDLLQEWGTGTSPAKDNILDLRAVSNIFVFCFLNLKESTFENRENVFLYKLKVCSWCNQIRILEFYIHYVMKWPNMASLNNRISWKVNTVWWWHLTGICHIAKEKYLSKNSTKKCGLESSSRPFSVSKELSTTHIKK